jgi:hypothetical protein
MEASGAANALFTLHEAHNPTDPDTGPGARQAARQARKDDLTARLGSDGANTQLANEADADADKVVAAVTPKVEQLTTENELLGTTLAQLKASQPGPTNTNPTSPLADVAVGANLVAGPRAQALGEARVAEYYTSTARNIQSSAMWWGPFLIIVAGVLGLLWNWYHQHPMRQLFLTVAVLAVASLFPVYVMQLPRAAISPLLRLV